MLKYKIYGKFENRLNDYFEVESEGTIALLEEYLSFGGYPSVVLEDKSSKVNYWRTKDKSKVDFIINMRNQLIPLK